MGLIKEGDQVAVLTDILGLENALGEMNFKVAGTRKGVTSIQMDINVEGLTFEILEEALQRAQKGRLTSWTSWIRPWRSPVPSCRVGPLES